MSNNPEQYDPGGDLAVARLAWSVTRRARWALPNALVEHDQMLPEINQLTALFRKRVEHLAEDATRASGALVEIVVTGVEVVGTEAFYGPTGGPADLHETRASRVQAERIALARQVLDAAARVETVSKAHRHRVDALRAAAVEAAHHLNVVFRQTHRFADEFAFAPPDALHVDAAVYEIGLARVRAALEPSHTAQHAKEGAA